LKGNSVPCFELDSDRLEGLPFGMIIYYLPSECY